MELDGLVLTDLEDFEDESGDGVGSGEDGEDAEAGDVDDETADASHVESPDVVRDVRADRPGDDRDDDR